MFSHRFAWPIDSVFACTSMSNVISSYNKEARDVFNASSKVPGFLEIDKEALHTLSAKLFQISISFAFPTENRAVHSF